MTPATTEPQTTIAIPWGDRDPLALELPAAWPAAEVVWPDLDGAIDDYPAALGQGARRDPRGARRSSGRSGRDRPWRSWSTTRRAGRRSARPCRSSWTGSTRSAYAPRTSRSASGWAAITPWTPRRCANGSATRSRTRTAASARRSTTSRRTSDLGETPEGVPVRVFRPVAEADCRILIGSVLPHLQAGFGGGLQADLPGDEPPLDARGARTGRAWAATPAGCSAATPAQNPMRRAIRAAAEFARALRLDQPPDRCAGAGAPGRGRAPGPRSRTGSRPRPGGGSRRPRRRRPTWSSRATTPGRATRCRASRSCCSTARRAGPVASSSASSGPIPSRSTARSRCPRCGRSRRRASWAAGRSAAAWRWPTGPPRPSAAPARSCSAGPASWSSIGRSWSTPRRSTTGSAPGSGPIRLFADQARLWRAAAEALGDTRIPRVRVFPQGGLTYAPEGQESAPNDGMV